MEPNHKGPGNVFIVTAPSGTGKSTLVHRLLDTQPNLRFSVSHTTRPPRAGEVDGRDYFFIDESAFKRLVAANEFLEHAEVHGHLYGTSKAQIDHAQDRGFDVVLDIDIAGASQIKQRLPQACAIFILPPDYAALRTRLEGRAKDSSGVIATRLANATREVGAVRHFDYVLVNDDLDNCYRQLETIYLADRYKTFRRQGIIAHILETFPQVK